MSSKFILIFLLLPIIITAQNKIVICDKDTKETISFVNIGFDNNGFTADENGVFVLPESGSAATLHFTAVGYADASFKKSEIRDTVYLHQKEIDLETLVIASKKRSNALIINSLKNSKNTWMGAGGGINGSLMNAIYFEHKEKYSATPYLDKVRLKIKTIGNNTFNIRIYGVNDNGYPGDYLYNDNILVSVKSNQKYAEADFSKLNLQVPKEGLFLVVEHIAIATNRLTTDDLGNHPAYMYAYGPQIMGETTDVKGGWSYINGQWKENKKTEKGFPKIAMEITLTD